MFPLLRLGYRSSQRVGRRTMPARHHFHNSTFLRFGGKDNKKLLIDVMRSTANGDQVNNLFHELNTSNSGFLSAEEWRSFVSTLREVRKPSNLDSLKDSLWPFGKTGF